MSPSEPPEVSGLLKVQLRAPHTPDAPVASRMVVHCPRLQKEVLLQRCDFCAHGRGLQRDLETGELWLRCDYLDTPGDKSG